jgi:hypothetical protein
MSHEVSLAKAEIQVFRSYLDAGFRGTDEIEVLADYQQTFRIASPSMQEANVFAFGRGIPPAGRTMKRES